MPTRVNFDDNGEETGAFSFGPQGVTLSGNSIQIDASFGNCYRTVLTQNSVIPVPVSGIDNQEIYFHLIQDSVGGRTVTWCGFNFGALTQPTLSTAPGKNDFIVLRYLQDPNMWLVQGYFLGY